MIRLTIVESNADLLNEFSSDLHDADYTTMQLSTISNLNNWVARHHPDLLVLSTLVKNVSLPTTATRKNTLSSDSNFVPECWHLNSSQMELAAPDGKSQQLSHNEYCILRAAANADGSLVSRKTLIEALGYKFLHYDERRLEAIISRLRRKLASFSQHSFSVRSVRGRGYLFCVELLEVSAER